MIGRQKFGSYLERKGIVQMRGPEAVAAHAAFKERTDGFLEIAWYQHGWTPENLKKAFEQYGFDCYTQGVVDGATTCKMKPELIEFMNDCTANPSEKQP